MVHPASVATGVLVGGILAVGVVGMRRQDFATVANAVGSVVVAVFPVAVEVVGPTVVGGGVTIGRALPLWIAAAGFVHSVGMLGPYDSIWWWDTLTHAVSGALVAALAYAGFVVLARHATVAALPPGSVAALTVSFILVAGVFWELIELVARDVGKRLDVEPVLVHYGVRDTAIDLLVDVLAAVAVVLVDLRVFVPIAEQSPDLTAWLVAGSGAILLVGSVALGLCVDLRRIGQP